MKIITEKVTNGQAAAFWKRWFQFEAYLSVSNGMPITDSLSRLLMTHNFRLKDYSIHC
jgi:hypothetical protein